MIDDCILRLAKIFHSSHSITMIDEEVATEKQKDGDRQKRVVFGPRDMASCILKCQGYQQNKADMQIQ